MDWLNYNHLYYFSVIAHEGGIAAAARKLRLTHSTLSAQLKLLEEQFGVPLFERRGKRLVLTAFGNDAVTYAADIFRLGRQLQDVAQGRAATERNIVRVGVLADLPKSLVHQLLSPAKDNADCVVWVRQGKSALLLDMLVAGQLHIVLLDHIATPPVGARLHAHLLGEADVGLYGTPALLRRARRGLPKSLSQVPMVLPPTATPLRKRLDAWFVRRDIQPNVVAEVEDAGLLKVFGAAGRGLVALRAGPKDAVESTGALRRVVICDGLRDAYYAVSTERRIRHPGVRAMIDGARATFAVPAASQTVSSRRG